MNINLIAVTIISRHYTIVVCVRYCAHQTFGPEYIILPKLKSTLITN